MPESLYFKNPDLKNFSYCDVPEYTYYWLDRKIDSKENKNYLEKFKVENHILPFSDSKAFWSAV